MKSLSLIFALLLSAGTTAQTLFNYKVEKVNDDVYVLKPQTSEYRWVTANIIVIINEADVLVVDSGLTPDAAIQAIKEIKKLTPKPVKYLVNTHWHGDHWQGNEVFQKTFPGIQIIATEQGKLAMQENGLVWIKKLYLKHYGGYVNAYEKAIAEKKLYGETLSETQLTDLKTAIPDVRKDIEAISRINPTLPNVTYSERMVIADTKRDIELLYLGVGNTGGDAIVFLPREKILIPGDLVVHPSPFESGMFSPEWLGLMKKMNALDYQVLLPGHGEIQRDKAYLGFLIAFFEEIIAQVRREYVANGTSAPDELRKVVTDKTVGDKLSENNDYKRFVEQLSPGFVSQAVATAAKRIIQGRK